MTVRLASVCAAVCVAAMAALPAQEREDRTLLSSEQMRAIINEASGERAMHHVLELVPYQRVRPVSEYQGHLRESEVMARFAKDYGYSNVQIETFPQAGQIYQATVGELWMTAPESLKLYDIHDVALALGQGTPTGDVSGDLVDVGAGRAAGSRREGPGRQGPPQLQRPDAVRAGRSRRARSASSATRRCGRTTIPIKFPTHASRRRPAPRRRRSAGRSNRASAATSRCSWDAARRSPSARWSKAEMLPGKMEVVHAEIPGDGSTTQEVAISGHLYEGYIKQGANDDNSGCALTLEIGRDLPEADCRGQAAEAEAHDQLPVGPRDQRHQCVAQRASREGEGRSSAT